jgi:protease PrsW
MTYFSLIVFALLPSTIWLLYYLRKDSHPEPKKLILYVFLFGALSAGVGYLFQVKITPFFFSSIESLSLSLLFAIFFYRFILIAFSEEFLKYLAFSFSIKGNKEVDEPIDLIIYMITAGLGFAALENFIILSSLDIDVLEIAKVSFLRFLSGTLLHALVSGIMGCFLAYAYRLNKKHIIFLGLLVVTFLHGTYNIIAERIEEGLFLVFFLVFFSFLLSILSLTIKKVKKLKSISLLK